MVLYIQTWSYKPYSPLQYMYPLQLDVLPSIVGRFRIVDLLRSIAMQFFYIDIIVLQ